MFALDNGAIQNDVATVEIFSGGGEGVISNGEFIIIFILYQFLEILKENDIYFVLADENVLKNL